MKFYSEKLNELFDTAEALKEAEDLAGSKRKKKVSEKTTSNSEVEQPSRKQLAAEVDQADADVKEAYANYEAAKLQVEELSKKYLEEVDKLLEPAKTKVKETEQKRYEAIRKFNDSYGAYQVTYTGAKAADELTKAISNMNSRVFRNLFWF